jgi:hypothetical protein
VKVFTVEAMDALQEGATIVSGAVEIACDPPIRLWGGYGLLEIDGNEYQPIGDRGVAQVSNAALGGAAQGITLTLSGVEAEALELLDADEVHDAPVKLYRLIFSGDGRTLLDYHVFTRGRLDQVSIDEIIGGPAAITVSVQSQAKGLGRKGGRMRTDADQRLINPDDGFFKNVAFAGQKQLYWGGQRPVTAGAALAPTASTGSTQNWFGAN